MESGKGRKKERKKRKLTRNNGVIIAARSSLYFCSRRPPFSFSLAFFPFFFFSALFLSFSLQRPSADTTRPRWAFREHETRACEGDREESSWGVDTKRKIINSSLDNAIPRTFAFFPSRWLSFLLFLSFFFPSVISNDSRWSFYF